MDKEKYKELCPYYVALTILTVLIVVLSVADIYLVLNPLLKYVEMDLDNVKPYTELTKEEALGAYIKLHEPGYAPRGYIDEAVLQTDGCKPMNSLIYSYGDSDDVEENYDAHANKVYKDDYTIQDVKFVNDYYAIVFASVGSGYCERAFSFNKKYFDYSTGMYVRGMFADTSSGLVKKLLPVLATTDGAYATLDSIYDYNFDEDSDKIVLNVYSLVLTDDEYGSPVSVYWGQAKSRELSYSLKFRIQKFRYDKVEKRADWVRDCDGCDGIVKTERTIALDRNTVRRLVEKIDEYNKEN